MRLTLKEKTSISEDVLRFSFEPEGKIGFKAGQYLRYELDHDDPDERGINRFFTISSAPFEDEIMITTRILKKGGSSFKRRLVNMEPGDDIYAYGPSGDFVVGDGNRSLLFIAGGIGITPFRSIILDLLNSKVEKDIVLLYSSRDKVIPFEGDLDRVQQSGYSLDVHYVIHPEICDLARIIGEVPDWKERMFYLSGPPGMISSIEASLVGRGVSSQNIKLDYFPGYK